MSRWQVLASALTLGGGVQDVSAQSLFDPLQNVARNTPYERVRSDLLAAGWLPQANGAGTCQPATWVCQSYPETSQCWTEEGGDSYCAMLFADRDPVGSELRVIVSVDPQNPDRGLHFDAWDEQAKGGRG